MAAAFWDRKGVLMVEFMQQGITVSEMCCDTLKELCRAFQNKRCGMLTSSVMLLHDNACLHTAAHTQALLKHINLESDHPPCSPDLALSVYHLLSTWRTGWVHRAATILRSWWKMSKHGWAHRCILLWQRHTKAYSSIQQMPQFRWWLLVK
jgi:hypothetical protein